ncbi:MAG: pantoate--beta-alanine ligase [Phycisphaerales bacterium]|nr:pantoate--beta-alanine ligase [Phycisphaerales bacterium]
MRVLHTPDHDLTQRCVLVPTMGALHGGHASLIQAAVRRARIEGVPSAVSIFVNPKQFNDPTDFDSYPDRMDDDLAMCRDAGVDIVFHPSVDVVYPPGEDVSSDVIIPDVASKPGLEDTYRPGHFAGVCQVVSRLFDLCAPSAAVFGEKDWQQLQCVRTMSRLQGRDLQIIPAETVREDSGLAMSSRNLNLTPEARIQAVAISQALFAASNMPTPEMGESLMHEILIKGGITPEYAAIRPADSLMPLPDPSRNPYVPCRALIAAKVGGVRLIDNAPWTPVAYA